MFLKVLIPCRKFKMAKIKHWKTVQFLVCYIFWRDPTKYVDLWLLLGRILEYRKMWKKETSNALLVNAGVKLKTVILSNVWFIEININSLFWVSSQENCKQSVNNLSRIITGFMLMFVIILQINISSCLNILVQGTQ